MVKKIGILNGGGDVQPINAVIASIVKSGSKRGFEFIGFERKLGRGFKSNALQNSRSKSKLEV